MIFRNGVGVVRQRRQRDVQDMAGFCTFRQQLVSRH